MPKRVAQKVSCSGIRTVAVGDGALGFWKALDETFPSTRHQRCWLHKTLNVLDKFPKSIEIGERFACYAEAFRRRLHRQAGGLSRQGDQLGRSDDGRLAWQMGHEPDADQRLDAQVQPA